MATVASKVGWEVLSQAGVVHVAFARLEGQEEDELPECVLGAVRLKRVGESSFRKLPPKAEKKKSDADDFGFARDDPARRPRRVSSPTGVGGG